MQFYVLLFIPATAPASTLLKKVLPSSLYNTFYTMGRAILSPVFRISPSQIITKYVSYDKLCAIGPNNGIRSYHEILKRRILEVRINNLQYNLGNLATIIPSLKFSLKNGTLSFLRMANQYCKTCQQNVSITKSCFKRSFFYQCKLVTIIRLGKKGKKSILYLLEMMDLLKNKLNCNDVFFFYVKYFLIFYNF